jgi:hypothetical protein
MKTPYHGFIITTPYGLDENDLPYIVYRIHKANPLTYLESGEHFSDPDTALACAKDFIDEHLTRQEPNP